MKHNLLYYFVCVCICFVCIQGAPVYAQVANGQSLSVSPTLFNMTAVRGQTWHSSIKVINNNSFPLTVYANVVNFAPQGESGEGKFLPVFTAVTEGTTLAEWIDIQNDSVTIAPQKTELVSFRITVPEDAAPGGHFAAVLIGTKPPAQEGSLKIGTSQVVTSLFFVRLSGDVKEEGIIREFRVARHFVSSPKADFEVRFENKGNVHIQPQGEIRITNMWGKERGVIPINHQTHFGNVLPLSIRKFDFSWKSEQSFSDIGRYKAELTLAYGEEGRQFVTSNDYFYVVPIKAGIITSMTLLAFILLVRWSIKAYVRKMLLLAGVAPSSGIHSRKRSYVQEGDVRIVPRGSIQTPVLFGFRDFKQQMQKTQKFFEKLYAIVHFVWMYKLFFSVVIALILFLFLLVLFIKNARTEQRDYEVTINNIDKSIILSSEEILYEKNKSGQTTVATTTKLLQEQNFELILVNSSDTPGAAAHLQTELQAAGYEVAHLQSDFNTVQERSVIVYDVVAKEEALDLSKKMGGIPLSARPTGETTKATITIFIGNEYELE